MCDNSLNQSGEPGRICDACLGDKVTGALRNSGRLNVRDLHVVARGGDISLHGELPTYYEKQLAQQIAMSIDEVGQVRNETAVRPPAGN